MTGQRNINPTLSALATILVAAFNDGNAVRLGSFYTDDAVLMVPNTPMLNGRESIESHLRRVFDQGTSKMTVTPPRILARWGPRICGGHLFSLDQDRHR